MKRYLQIAFFIAIILSFSAFFGFHFDDYFSVRNIVHVKSIFLDLGYLAPVYLTILFVFLNITGIPRVFFTIFSGYVFGVFYGFIYSWIATMIGLIVTFVMVRYLFRDGFEKRFGQRKLVEKMNLHVEKYGIWSVIFLRVIYVVPSSILNYTFGFTKISTSSYFYGSAIGFVPVVFLNVWAGNALTEKVFTEFGLDYKIILAGLFCLALVYRLKVYLKRF